MTTNPVARQPVTMNAQCVAPATAMAAATGGLQQCAADATTMRLMAAALRLRHQGIVHLNTTPCYVPVGVSPSWRPGVLGLNMVASLPDCAYDERYINTTFDTEVVTNVLRSGVQFKSMHQHADSFAMLFTMRFLTLKMRPMPSLQGQSARKTGNRLAATNRSGVGQPRTDVMLAMQADVDGTMCMARGTMNWYTLRCFVCPRLQNETRNRIHSGFFFYQYRARPKDVVFGTHDFYLASQLFYMMAEILHKCGDRWSSETAEEFVLAVKGIGEEHVANTIDKMTVLLRVQELLLAAPTGVAFNFAFPDTRTADRVLRAAERDMIDKGVVRNFTMPANEHHARMQTTAELRTLHVVSLSALNTFEFDGDEQEPAWAPMAVPPLPERQPSRVANTDIGTTPQLSIQNSMSMLTATPHAHTPGFDTALCSSCFRPEGPDWGCCQCSDVRDALLCEEELDDSPPAERVWHISPRPQAQESPQPPPHDNILNLQLHDHYDHHEPACPRCLFSPRMSPCS